jgi:GNAT superfamily N-acetyltransferase
MNSDPTRTVRLAEASDVAALAMLRSAWSGVADDPHFERHMAEWFVSEADRRTTWLAELDGSTAGMASLFEYRRMPRPRSPDSCWGYVGNLFVREGFRNRGIGSALLAAVVTAADARGYARLVVSPSTGGLGLFRRAGFRDAGDPAGERLLVRPTPSRRPGRLGTV